MYQFSYGDILADSPVDARAQEREALDHAIRLLRAAAASPPHSAEERAALSFTNQLWGIFIHDLASPDNDLPGETRALIMSIGLWVLAEAQRIEHGETRGLHAIADVCGTIRDGLH